MNIQETKILPSRRGLLSVKRSEGAWTIAVDGATLACLAEKERTPKALHLALVDASPASGVPAASWMLDVLHGLFGTERDLARVVFDLTGRGALREELLRFGLVIPFGASIESVVCERGMFWQHPELWIGESSGVKTPLVYKMSGGTRHPVRAPKSRGEVYRRFIPELGQSLSLRTIDIGTDLERFNTWMNDPRVSFFWELEGSLEKHAEYIHTLLADDHAHPILVCLDDEPFAYTEVYWAKEDRLGPYYASDDYDRGFHALVGNPKFRGAHRVAAWMPSVAHYMFLDDPRTRRLVCEPRATNDKFIGYLQKTSGFYRQKEFDFPHKRAALMALEREAFFEQFSP